MRHLVVLACLLGVLSCGGDGGSPTNPTTPPPGGPPQQQSFALSGTVNAAPGGPISGATVRIADSANAGKSAQTDNAGRYTLSGLQQAGFTVEASAAGYITRAQGVTLTRDTTQNFTLLTVEPWTRSGAGNSVFDIPRYFNRVRIYGRWSGSGTSNFIVRINGSTVVNAILRNQNPYEGVHINPGGVVEIRSSENIREWRFTEER